MPPFKLEIVNTPANTFSTDPSSGYACLNHQRWDRPVSTSIVNSAHRRAMLLSALRELGVKDVASSDPIGCEIQQA